MSLLDRLRGARKRTEKIASQRKVKQSAEQLRQEREGLERQRRIESGDPEGFLETGKVAHREAAQLGAGLKEIGATLPGAGMGDRISEGAERSGDFLDRADRAIDFEAVEGDVLGGDVDMDLGLDLDDLD